MQTELKQIQREVGITTVFVTHDQEEALTLCDRMAIFNRGQVVQIGPPNQVYERPTTVFAAQFLGAANFFTGCPSGQRNGLGRVMLDGGGEIFTEDPLPEAGTPANLIVRPEKLTISARAEYADVGTSTMNELVGRLDTISYLGSSIVYTVSASPGQITVFQQNREAVSLTPGKTVFLRWLPRHSVLVRG